MDPERDSEPAIGFRTLIEGLGEGLIFCDRNDIILHINKKMAEMLGRSVEEMVGKPVESMLVPPSESDTFRQFTDRRLKGISESYEAHVMRKNGSRFWVLINATPIRDSTGAIIGTLGTLLDITDRKKAEEENIRLHRQLLQSQKMEAIGQLVAGIAHDLNNALAAVVGHLQLMERQIEPSSELHHSVDVARSGCERSLSLIERLLGFSRQGKYNVAEISLDALLKETLEFLSRIIGKDVRIETDILSNELTVKIDSDQVQQVLINLIINARQAMPEGGVITFTLNARQVSNPAIFNPKAPPGSFVTLSVADNGVGIPAENLDKVFEPFFTTKNPEEGSGLGLAMVYGIMQNHGGWVEVESAPNLGSVFTLYFPRVAAIAKALPAKVVSVAPQQAQGSVMVVDDEPYLVELTKKFLNLAGLTAHSFSYPLEAVEWYRNHWKDVDLVILDMKMPKMDGKKCFEELLKINPKVKAVVLSGYLHDSAAKDLLERGVLRFFLKPLKYPELMQWVCSNIGKDRAK